MHAFPILWQFTAAYYGHAMNFFGRYEKWKKVLYIFNFSFAYAFNTSVIVNMHNILHFLSFYNYFFIISNQYLKSISKKLFWIFATILNMLRNLS